MKHAFTLQFPLASTVRIPLLVSIFILAIFITFFLYQKSPMREQGTIAQEDTRTEEQKAVVALFEKLDHFDGTIKSVIDYSTDKNARHIVIETEIPDISRLPAHAANADIPMKKEVYTVRVSDTTVFPGNATKKALTPGMFVRVVSVQNIYTSTYLDAEELTVLFSPVIANGR